MRISFDLDETLFVNPEKISVEPQLKIPFRWIYKERLRLGAPDLLRRIKNSGIELWIYTTSFRTQKYINNYFKRYGIKIDNVINGQIHNKDIQRDFNAILPSKIPSRYRINLHVDDEKSVAEYGKIYGFKVFLLNDENPLWTEDLWKTVNALKL